MLHVGLAKTQQNRKGAWTARRRQNVLLTCTCRQLRGHVPLSSPELCGAHSRPCNCISRESNPGHIDGNDVFYH